MKHTKGPWNWTYKSKGLKKKDFEIYDNDEQLGSIWRGIAKLPDHRNAKINRANAILIAAAPEMLQTLELVLSLINSSDFNEQMIRCSVWNQVDIVVSKAKGKSK